ncbi:MAG: hypothetical protein CMN20_09890 [Roseovarius sp.]|nr:hypothetical protein [Roseovarius sp.]
MRPRAPFWPISLRASSPPMPGHRISPTTNAPTCAGSTASLLWQPTARPWPPFSPGVADPLWSTRALASLTAQDHYLRPLNSTAADAVLTEIERLAALIAELPHMGRRIDATGPSYHVTASDKYRMNFRVREERVKIDEVLHLRRG